MKLGHHLLPIAKFFITKNYLPVFVVFIITLQTFSQTNEKEQGIYNPIQNTEYANKYSDLKYDKYPYKSEPIKEREQTTKINDFWFLNNFVVLDYEVCTMGILHIHQPSHHCSK